MTEAQQINEMPQFDDRKLGVLAFTTAAQLAATQASCVISPDGKETALSILAEYGWRTSHYIG